MISMLCFDYVLFFASIKTFQLLSKIFQWLFPLLITCFLCPRIIPFLLDSVDKRNHQNIAVHSVEVLCVLKQTRSQDAALHWYHFFIRSLVLVQELVALKSFPLPIFPLHRQQKDVLQGQLIHGVPFEFIKLTDTGSITLVRKIPYWGPSQ